jgi:archaeal cell division control protein 6
LGSNDPVDKLLDNAISGKSLIKDRKVLQTKFEPETILHRDAELAKVTQALLPILKQGRPSNLLIYGKPGTGKTLVVSKVLSKIAKKVENSEFPIKFIYVNAKDETTIYGLLVSLGSKLGLELPTTGLSISIVFSKIIDTIKKNTINAVFVIDEIDYLAELASKTGKDILYNLTRANERLEGGSLTLIGISNLLSFKERLDPRVISSLGEEEIIFTNYSVDQIKEILSERIKEAFIKDAIGAAALNLCAAMAGQEHGDARRAIDLLRVAGELAEREQAANVTEDHIRRAAQKMEEDKELTALNAYPLHEKLLIVAVMRSNGSTTGEVYHTYKEICKTIRQKEITHRRATQILSDIELSGLISGKIVHQGMHGRTKKYHLTVQPETVKKAFHNDILLADIL